MSKSIAIPTGRARAALLIDGKSVPKIARKHGAAVSTVYAVLEGRRPGNGDKTRRAVAEVRRIVRRVELTLELERQVGGMK